MHLWLKFGMTQITFLSGSGSRILSFLPAHPVEAATCWKATRRIVLAMGFLHAADAYGPGELFNVLDTRRQNDD